MTSFQLQNLKPIFPSGSKHFRHPDIHLSLPKTANQLVYYCPLRITMNWFTENLFLILLRRGLQTLKAGVPKLQKNYEKPCEPEEVPVIHERNMVTGSWRKSG